MRQVVLNVIIAFLWVLFQDEEAFKVTTFFSGYLIGLIVIYILHRFFGQEFYLKKVWVASKVFSCLFISINYIKYDYNQLYFI
jgi:multicomponent Na+:H+ antiporter subunit E